jgi:hypothetical protein
MCYLQLFVKHETPADERERSEHIATSVTKLNVLYNKTTLQPQANPRSEQDWNCIIYLKYRIRMQAVWPSVCLPGAISVHLRNLHIVLYSYPKIDPYQYYD